MYLDVDLDLGNLIVSSPGLRSAISSVSFKFDTDEPVRVRFWRDGVQVELNGGAVEGAFGIKLKGKYDGDLLVEATEWTKVGEGDSTYYEFSPNFNTEAISTAILEGDGNTDNDLDFVEGMLEVKWVIDGKKHRTLNSPQTLVYNSILKPEDNTPLAKADPAAWLLGTTAPATAETVTIGGDPTVSAVPVVFPTLYRDGSSASGRPKYSDNPGGAADYILSWYDSSSPNGWLLEAGTEGGTWLAEVDVDTIDEIPDGSFVAVMGGGTPTLTHVDVSTAPPFFRVFEGFLYFQDEEGAWVRIAHSSF